MKLLTELINELSKKAKAPVIGLAEAFFDTRTHNRTDYTMNFTTTPARNATLARTEMFPGVPYITHPVGQPYADINCFDVPAETYTAGNRTGIHVAAQLFKVAKDVEEGFLLSSIRAACRHLEQADADGNTAGTVDKVGAAVGFMDMVEQLLNQACRQIDLSTLISNNLEGYEQAAEQDLKEMRDQNAALMNLMRLPAQISLSEVSGG